jgi:hypothetical protein
MIEQTILKLLVKISKQLEDISQFQEKIGSDIITLQKELTIFQEYTYTLEDKLNKSVMLSTSIN